MSAETSAEPYVDPTYATRLAQWEQDNMFVCREHRPDPPQPYPAPSEPVSDPAPEAETPSAPEVNDAPADSSDQ